MSLKIGQILHNRYRIEALLAQGGMGAVYRATDLTFGATVALKENLDTSPQAQKQFAREAGILHGLRHPNLPRVTDYFFLPGQGQYLVMDYVEGQDLDQMLARGPLPETQALAWIGQVLDALEYLHNQTPPIIHRDVKPANVKITPQGRAMLVDFGLAKVYDPVLRTTIGARAVTPGYAPPEQYGQGRTDARSDLYAVGATLYALLTGQEPPDGVDLMVGNETLTPPRQLNRNLSPHIEAAILKALRPRPTDRPQTVREFRAALSAPPPPRQPPPAPAAPVRPRPAPAAAPRRAWLWIVGGLLLAVALIWGVSRLSTPEPGSEPTQTVIAAVTATLLPGPSPSPSPEPTRTTVVTATATPSLGVGAGDTQTRSKDGMVMVYVPAGEFTMGSNDGDSDEQPVHTVTLDAFWIDQTEVTNAQYRRCVEAGACTAPRGTRSYTRDRYYDNNTYDDYPVIYVNWHQAKAYCQWVEARLPTEAEWEKAARGTDGRVYPWGNSAPDCNKANYYDDVNKDYCVGDTTRVGSYPAGASPYGALDMAGNVWEWCADWYGSDYYSRSPESNPQGPDSGDSNVLRGGGWYHRWYYVRAARRGLNPGNTNDNIGFRCAAGSPGG